MLTNRERYIRTMHYQAVDHAPLHVVGAWADTLERWYGEGLPRGADVHAELGIAPVHVANISPNSGASSSLPDPGAGRDGEHAHLSG